MSSDLDGDADRAALAYRPGADQRYRVIFDAVNDGIFMSDPNTGEFIDINQPGCKMFGYDKAELLGRSVDILSSGIHPHTREMAVERNEKARQGEPQIFEWQCKNRDGVLFWTEISLRYTEFDNAPAIVAIIRNIDARKRLDAQIIYMAQHDFLTGLANRATFAESLDRAIAHSLRTGRSFAVLCLDLDHFKEVNDSRGHATGDRLLSMVAERLRAVVRLNENVARFGGDEFAMLLDDAPEPEEIAALANRLVASISEPFLINGADVHVGVSIGVAIYSDNARDAEALLAQADVALYRAKTEGRNGYRFYSDAMNAEVRLRVALRREIRLAIPAGQFFLVYQPQVRVDDGSIIGVEALIRWRHPRRGVVMPGGFLPEAEASGVIGQIGEWVLQEACRQGRRWIDAGIGPGTIAVNLSTAHFKSPLELERMVFATLAETGFPPSQLELEITETTLINLSPEHAEVIQRLRRAGVRFSLDDFGTGYSSLSYLRRFAIDRIKIAQEFISELATSNEASSIVKLILGLSRDIGSEVIAEGVETPEQLSLLQDLHCANVQGYYYARPMPAEALGPLLSAGKILPSATKADPAAAMPVARPKLRQQS